MAKRKARETKRAPVTKSVTRPVKHKKIVIKVTPTERHWKWVREQKMDIDLKPLEETPEGLVDLAKNNNTAYLVKYPRETKQAFSVSIGYCSDVKKRDWDTMWQRYLPLSGSHDKHGVPGRLELQKLPEKPEKADFMLNEKNISSTLEKDFHTQGIRAFHVSAAPRFMRKADFKGTPVPGFLNSHGRFRKFIEPEKK